jgi:hypothetical protein
MTRPNITTGPWHLIKTERGDYCLDIEQECKNGQIEYLCPFLSVSNDTDESEAQANVKAIAALPEVLCLLESIAISGSTDTARTLAKLALTLAGYKI